MTESFEVTPKAEEQNLIVRIGRCEAEITNVVIKYCAVLLKLTTDRHEAPRGLFATAELLVTSV